MIFLILLLGLAIPGTVLATDDWKLIEPGLELRVIVPKESTPVGDGQITIVRIDPTLWELRLVGLSRTGSAAGRTAREWATYTA